MGELKFLNQVRFLIQSAFTENREIVVNNFLNNKSYFPNFNVGIRIHFFFTECKTKITIFLNKADIVYFLNLITRYYLSIRVYFVIQYVYGVIKKYQMTILQHTSHTIITNYWNLMYNFVEMQFDFFCSTLTIYLINKNVQQMKIFWINYFLLNVWRWSMFVLHKQTQLKVVKIRKITYQ